MSFSFARRGRREKAKINKKSNTISNIETVKLLILKYDALKRIRVKIMTNYKFTSCYTHMTEHLRFLSCRLTFTTSGNCRVSLELHLTFVYLFFFSLIKLN